MALLCLSSPVTLRCIQCSGVQARAGNNPLSSHRRDIAATGAGQDTTILCSQRGALFVTHTLSPLAGTRWRKARGFFITSKTLSGFS